MFNKVTMVGRWGNDPEVRDVKGRDGDIAMVSMRLAVDKPFQKGKDKECDWWTVKAWRGLAESLDKHAFKGQVVLVDGTITKETWENREGVEVTDAVITADTIRFLSWKDDGDRKGNGNGRNDRDDDRGSRQSSGRRDDRNDRDRGGRSNDRGSSRGRNDKEDDRRR